jgi:predicted AlkP superfamily phosphohydrolase/phosphomutase
MNFKIILIFSIIIIILEIQPSLGEASMPKVLVIGLDGATFDIILPWVKEGKLPNFKKLINEGSYGNSTSTLPTVSPVAWTSFATGVNPGKHGIFGFLTDYESNPVIRTDVKSKSFWEIASENGKRVITMNVPMTYPPEEINGTMISGYESPEGEIFTYPANLTQELINKGYQIEALNASFKSGNEDEFLKSLYYTEGKREEIALDLMKKEKWDIFIIVFTETDRMQHYFWNYMEDKDPKYGDEILKFYQKIDKTIGNFLNQTDNNTNVIIMSDHGFGPLKGEIYLNTYFMNNGMLNFKSPLTYWLIKLGLTQQSLASRFEQLQKTPIVRFINFVLEKFGLKTRLGTTSPVALDSIDLSGLTNIGKIFPYLTYDYINFSKTKIYAENFGGGIYLNVKGRDSLGMINQEDYKKIVLETMKDLSELKNSKGEKLFENVYAREDLYNGPYVDNAPDIIVESESNGYDTVGWLGYNTLISSNDIKSGNHRKNGMIILWGKNFSRGIIENASIIDIAPTILKVIDLKIPEDMDGKPLIK